MCYQGFSPLDMFRLLDYKLLDEVLCWDFAQF